MLRSGNDWTQRYPLVAEAVNHLKVRSCLIDGEAVACDNNGVAVFARIRRSGRPSKTSQGHGVIGNGVTVTGAKLLPSLAPVACYR